VSASNCGGGALSAATRLFSADVLSNVVGFRRALL
jgi:hypothetical protein